MNAVLVSLPLYYIILYGRLANTAFTKPVPPDLNPLSWCHWIALKVRSFVSQAWLNRIPVKSSLFSWGVKIDDVKCSLCVGQQESASDRLVSSSLAISVWNHVARCSGVYIEGVKIIRSLSFTYLIFY